MYLSISLRLFAFAALILISLSSSSPAYAFRPTVIDHTFNPDLSSFGDDPGSIATIAVQADGKLLLGGNDSTGMILRLNPDGTTDSSFRLDPTFAEMLQNNTPSFVTSIVLQPDQKILVLVYSGSPSVAAFLARLNPDGSFDSHFFLVSLNPSTGNISRTLALLPDNRIFISDNFDTANGISTPGVAILEPDGNLDSRFDFAGFKGQVASVSLTTDGKLLVGQSFHPAKPLNAPLIQRLNADGSTDPSFAPRLAESLTGVNLIQTQSDSKILLIGSTYDPSTQNASSLLTRLLADGSPDPSFNPASQVLALNIQSLQVSGSHILVGGSTIGFGRYDYRLLSLNFDGSLDQNLALGIEMAGAYANLILPSADGNLVGTAFFPSTASLFWGDLLFGRFFIDYRKPGIEFENPIFTVSETNSLAVINLVRTGDNSAPLSVTFEAKSGTASAGVDFLPQKLNVQIPSNQEIYSVTVPIIDDSLVNGSRTIALTLTNPGSGAILGRITSAQLEIQDNESPLAVAGTAKMGIGIADADVDENNAVAFVAITRFGSSADPLSVDYITADGSAISGRDFDPVSGTLQFAPLETTKTVAIPLHDDFLVNGDRQFQLSLRHWSSGATLETGDTATVSIHDDDQPGSIDLQFDPHPILDVSAHGLSTFAVQPDGKILATGVFDTPSGDQTTSLERFNQNGSLDETFQVIVPANSAWGSWASVSALLPQPDGKILVAGDFRRINGEPRTSVARLQSNGELDQSFDTGYLENAGQVLALQSDGKLITGLEGNRGLCRLNSDGAQDSSFNPPFTNYTHVSSALLQPDGKLLVGGDLSLSNHNQIVQRALVRLTPAGTLDPSFAPALDSSPSQILLQDDGKILALSINPSLVRLNLDGSLDRSFRFALQPSDPSSPSQGWIALQRDGRILLAANRLQDAANNQLPGVVRLNSDGTLDKTFDPGNLADSEYTAIQLLPNDEILLAGTFDTFAGIPRAGMARLHGDPLLRLRNLQKQNNLFELALTTLPGRNYILQASGDLEQWQPIQTNSAPDFSLTLQDPNATQPAAFYRVIQKN